MTTYHHVISIFNNAYIHAEQLIVLYDIEERVSDTVQPL